MDVAPGFLNWTIQDGHDASFATALIAVMCPANPAAAVSLHSRDSGVFKTNYHSGTKKKASTAQLLFAIVLKILKSRINVATSSNERKQRYKLFRH